jgi:hypothetical protein
VVQHHAFSPQQDVQPPITKPPPDSSNLAQAGSQEPVISSSAAVTDRTAIWD